MRQGSSGRRPRGRPHRKQHLSPRSQTFDSNGPEGRVRGNAHQVYEKYLALARDATASGDRVAAEGFYQFAEHYYRLVNDSTDPQRRFDQGRDGAARGDGPSSPDDGTAAQPAVPRGNGAAESARPGGESDGAADRADARTAQPGDGGSEAAPRRMGLRRRKPNGGNGAADRDDDDSSQELVSSDGDTDVPCP